jgi:hypothetical protein
LSIKLNKILPLSERLTMILFFSISSFISILVPPSSSFWSAITFYLSFYCCDSLSTSSLFIPPLIFPKIVFLVCTKFLHSRNNLRRMKQINCKGWNGRKGTTFILSGLAKFFLF